MMPRTPLPIIRHPEGQIPEPAKRLRCLIEDSLRRQRLALVVLLGAACMVALAYATPVPMLVLAASAPGLAVALQSAPGVVLSVVVLATAGIWLIAALSAPRVVRRRPRRNSLIQLGPNALRIGRFTEAQLVAMANDLGRRMGLLIEPGLFLHTSDSPYPNAFYGLWVDHHATPDKLVLQRSLLSILTEDELRAVMAHELGHLLQPWPPLLIRPRRFGRRCELLADYNALVYAGLLPTVNAFVKLAARSAYLTALWEQAQALLLERDYDVDDIGTLVERARASLPQRLMGDADDGRAQRLVERFLRRLPDQRAGWWDRMRCRLKWRDLRRMRRWRQRWHRHRPDVFPAFFADQQLDEREFGILVARLRENPQADLIAPLMPSKQRRSTHPSLRERLLFLADCAGIGTSTDADAASARG